MYTIKDIHDMIFFLADKQQNAFFSHEDIDVWLDFYQTALMAKLTGRPEANTGYYPPQKSGVVQDQYFNDAINPFKKPPVNFLYSDTPGGVLTMPSDYLRLNSLYIQSTSSKGPDVKYSGVQVLGDDLIPDRLSSQLNPVSIGNPFGQWIGKNADGQNQIQLYPKREMAGHYTYLSVPVPPKFAYTMNGRQVIYDPTGSVDLQWNKELTNNIIMSTMQALGLNTSDQTLVQISEAKQREGTIA